MVKSIVAMALLMLSSTALRVDPILHDSAKHDSKIYHDFPAPRSHDHQVPRAVDHDGLQPQYYNGL
jgi:hypothetical protein